VRFAPALIATLALGACLAAPAQAATIPVTSQADSGPNTLREAILTAGADPDPDTIELDLPEGTPIALLTPLESLVGEIEILAPVAGEDIRVLRNPTAGPFRIFTVSAGSDVTLRGFTVRDGFLAGGNGAGIQNAGTLALENMFVGHNEIEGPTATGAGIENSGSMTIDDSLIFGNNIEASSFGFGAGISSNGPLTITDSVLNANFNIDVNGSGSALAWGGGILNGGSGTLNVVRSSITGNLALGTASTSANAQGAGIANLGGAVTLSRSLLGDNATLATGATVAATGGGISSVGGSVTLRSSTVSGNQVAVGSPASSGSARGGAVGAVSSNPALTILGSTVTNNHAGDTPPAGTTRQGDNLGGAFALTLASSILADPVYSASCSIGGSTITDQGYNLDEDGSCIASPVATDLTGDPGLGLLADNGGPTKTRAAANGSPVIDQGIATSSFSDDQRGVARPTDVPEVADAAGGDGSDIGAFEYEPSADLSVTQNHAPDPAYTGEVITYTVTVANSGPDSAHDTVLTDTLPDHTSFVSASPGCDHSAGVVTCDLATVASGASPEFEIVVEADAPGTFSNVAEVLSTTPDGDATDNESSAITAIGATAELSLTQSAAATVTAGDAIAFILTATNAGPNSGQGVTVEDTLPPGLTFASGPPECEVAGAVVSCDLGALALGEEVSVEVSATAVTPGIVVNEAVVSTTSNDPDPGNDSATASVTILPRPDPAAATKCAGLPVTITGTEGGDVLTGTSGPDVFAGLGGNDRIRGRGGRDVICAGAGNDRLLGGPGNDILRGQAGADFLKGGAGRDTLRGGAGRDVEKQ
jgi:uncharacterized repeat protein (TIGR01451 family)